MSLRDSPKDVHHLRNVVGDNNDGYGHLQHITFKVYNIVQILKQILHKFKISRKLKQKKPLQNFQIAILLQPFAMEKQNQHIEYEKLPVAYQKI